MNGFQFVSGGGSTTFNGDGEGDLLLGGFGDDILNGGSGTDTSDFSVQAQRFASGGGSVGG